MKKTWIKTMVKLTVLVILGCLFWYGVHFARFDRQDENIELSEDWDIILNGTEYDDVDLGTFSFPVAGDGDVIVMRKVLGEYNLKDPMLQFSITHTVIHVSLDGQEVFEYGEKYKAQDLMVGNGCYWINLPDDITGKELIITLNVSENNAFSGLGIVYLQNAEHIILNFVRGNILEIIIASFLLVTGVFCLTFVLSVWHKSKEYIMLVNLAAAAICCALWIAGNCGLLQLVSLNYHINTVIEFCSLYLASLFTLLFICELIENGRYQRIIQAVTTVNLAFTVFVLGCNIFGILHLQEFLKVFHVLAMISFCTIVVCLFLHLREKQTLAKRIFLMGAFVTVMLIMGDITRFNLQKYWRPNGAITVSIVPVAALCIVVTMAASYVVRMIQTYHANVEKDVLMKMAYTDALTGLPNRARCMEVLQEADKVMTETDISLVYMDLNFFKQINDTYGHSVGDEALIDFASVLKETLEKTGFVGRMAGDEFIAVFQGKEAGQEQTEAAVARLIEAIVAFNETHDRTYHLHTAYGCAYGNRREGVTGWSLCEEADEQMYYYKTQIKEEEIDLHVVEHGGGKAVHD